MNYKKLRDCAKEPTRATDGSIGYDLYAALEDPEFVNSGKELWVPTGIAIELPPILAPLVLPRSGLATKHGVTVANSPGLIDRDYHKEIWVCLWNHSAKHYLVEPGERIAQLIFLHYSTPDLELVDKFENESKRGGFGHTGRT